MITGVSQNVNIENVSYCVPPGRTSVHHLLACSQHTVRVHADLLHFLLLGPALCVHAEQFLLCRHVDVSQRRSRRLRSS